MLALQGGDEAALACLMDRWELPVKAFLLRFGLPEPDVEDLAQESFVKLYETRGRFRADARFKPWFLTIAGNLARNRLRWRTRHPTQSLDESRDGVRLVPEPLSDAPPPSAVLSGGEVRAQVRHAIASLPDSLREVVLCVEMEDLSHAEAAAVLHCTPKAVETRLARAREALRGALGKWLRQG